MFSTFTRILLLFGCVTIPAMAFDAPGHMQIADIAWAALAGAAATRAAIIAILKKARGQFKLVGNDPVKTRDAFDGLSLKY